MDRGKWKSVKVHKDTHHWARILAALRGVSLSDVFARLVEAEYRKAQQDDDPAVPASERSDCDNHSNHSTRKGEGQ